MPACLEQLQVTRTLYGIIPLRQRYENIDRIRDTSCAMIAEGYDVNTQYPSLRAGENNNLTKSLQE